MNEHASGLWQFREWSEIAESPSSLQSDILYETVLDNQDLDGPSVHSLVVRREGATSLLVFLPSGRPVEKTRRSVHYEFWKQIDQFPDSNLLFLSDPALKTSGERRLTYALHKDFDGVRLLAKASLRVSQAFGVLAGETIFYGFSQGGFLALQCATCVPFSKAVVCIPRLEIEDLPIKKDLEDIRAEAIGTSWPEFRKDHPERLNVYARMQAEDRIPSVVLVTNRDDYSILQTIELLDLVSQQSDYFSEIGQFELRLHPRAVGHAPLPVREVIDLLKGEVGRLAVTQSGRNSALNADTLVASGAPELATITRTNKMVNQTTPLKLSMNMSWVRLEQPVSSSRFKFEFSGGVFPSSRALLVSYDIAGITNKEFDSIPLAYSPMPTVRWFHYVKATEGEFLKVKDLPIPDNCTIQAVGLRLWQYEEDSVELNALIIEELS